MIRYTPILAVLLLAGCTTRKTETVVTDAGGPPILTEVRVTHADGKVETLKGAELDARRREGMKLILGEKGEKTPATVKVEKATITGEVKIGQRVGRHFVMDQMVGEDEVHGTVKVHVLTSGRSALTVGDVAVSGVPDYLEGVIEWFEEEGCKEMPVKDGVRRWMMKVNETTLVWRLVTVEVGERRLVALVLGGGFDEGSATEAAESATEAFLKDIAAPVAGVPNGRKPKKIEALEPPAKPKRID